MDLRKYDEDFVKKYHDDAEDNNYLYEYKSGEFQGGEVIGMQAIAEYCKSTKYNYEKDTTQKYVPILEFITEEGYRETDLQFPTCDNC